MSTIFDENREGKTRDTIARLVLGFAPYVVAILFLLVMGRIVVRGVPVIAQQGIGFLSQPSETRTTFYDENEVFHSLTPGEFREYIEKNPDSVILYKKTTDHTNGGILGPIAGTFALLIVGIGLAMLVGFGAAVFLNEYCGEGMFAKLLKTTIASLAGLPSLVFGLFGLAFFLFFLSGYYQVGPLRKIGFHAWLDQQFDGRGKNISIIPGLGTFHPGRGLHPRLHGSAYRDCFMSASIAGSAPGISRHISRPRCH